MGVDVQNRGWPAVNLLRRYPMADWVSGTDTTGSFTLPDDLLAELYFPVPADVSVAPTQFYIRKLALYAGGLSLTVGYDDGKGGANVATATASRASLSAFAPIALYGQGAFSSGVGKVVFGRLDGIDTQGAGQYAFDPAATQLDVDCIRPQLQGVASIAVADNNGVGTPLSGAVRLTLGGNIKLSNSASNTIRIDAIQGEGLNTSCDCAGLPAGATPLASINGIATTDGNFVFEGSSCLQIDSSGAGIKFNDTCSSPCCGCQEAQQLQSSIDYVLEQLRTLRDFQNRLSSEVARTVGTVIASRVSDSGCVTCP